MTPAPKRRWLENGMRADVAQRARDTHVIYGMFGLLTSAVVTVLVVALRVDHLAVWTAAGCLGMIVGAYWVWTALRRWKP
jgi:hypothetical protein